MQHKEAGVGGWGDRHTLTVAGCNTQTYCRSAVPITGVEPLQWVTEDSGCVCVCGGGNDKQNTTEHLLQYSMIKTIHYSLKTK